MTAHEGDAEEYAEAGGVDQAERGVVGILIVQEAEEQTDGQDGGPGTHFAKERLEGEPVKHNLFGKSAGKDEEREEEGGAPVGSGA